MIKWIRILITGFIVSLFLFPVLFRFLPANNTKNLMAAVGIVCFGIMMIKKKEFLLSRGLLILLLLSCVVSIVALLSMVYNQTPDNSYVSYIRSAIIWLSGAYAVCCTIRITHGYIDIPLVVNYLAGACVFQCVVAMGIQFVPAIQLFVDSTIEIGQGVLKDMNRIYGFGAFLDFGGSRFAAVLAAIAFLMVQNKEDRDHIPQFWLVLAFVIITVVGNMIARTTLVGVLVGLAYIILVEIKNLVSKQRNPDYRSPFFAWFGVLAFIIPVATILYNTNEQFYDLMRFGFEGIFSYFERGDFETASTNTLKTMIVWPEELRTWIIGDGYFANQRYDPNYIGNATTDGFYMGTDIGYLRFIFYFGVIGLVAISAVMVYAGVIACKVFPKYAHIFMMGVLCNFIIWLKVSTDLFPFLAIFACVAFLSQDLVILEEQKGDETVDEPCASSTT